MLTDAMGWKVQPKGQQPKAPYGRRLELELGTRVLRWLGESPFDNR